MKFIMIVGALGLLWILWQVKYFYLGVFVPIAVALLLARILGKRPTVVQYAVFATVLGAAFLIITQWHPNFETNYLPSVIVDNYQRYQVLSNPGDAIVYPSLSPSWMSILSNFPAAVFAGLFRPTLFDAHSLLQWLSAFENTLVLVLFLTALPTLTTWKQIGREDRLLVIAVALYIVALSGLLALSTPNYGTLVRYRVGFYPFFVLLLVHNSRVLQWLGVRMKIW